MLSAPISNNQFGINSAALLMPDAAVGMWPGIVTSAASGTSSAT